MNLLNIKSKTVKVQMTVYTGDEKGSLGWDGIKYPESWDPTCFELVEDTFYFVIKDVETLITVDGKEYAGGDKEGLNVYLGEAISIEEATIKYPYKDFSYPKYQGAKRVAIRKDGRVSPMYGNAMTYAEYCEQYNAKSQEQPNEEQFGNLKYISRLDDIELAQLITYCIEFRDGGSDTLPKVGKITSIEKDGRNAGGNELICINSKNENGDTYHFVVQDTEMRAFSKRKNKNFLDTEQWIGLDEELRLFLTHRFEQEYVDFLRIEQSTEIEAEHQRLSQVLANRSKI